MTTDNSCFYLLNRLIQISQTGGQWYSDTSPYSVPWLGWVSWQRTGNGQRFVHFRVRVCRVRPWRNTDRQN
jgi:hypothetical protein